MHIPERQQERARASTKQSPLQTQQLIPIRHRVHSRGAAAQGDQLRLKPHLIEVVQVQVTVAHLDSGKHGVVLPVDSVGGHVQQSRLCPSLTQDLRGSLCSYKQLRLGKERGNRLHFAQYEGRALVRNSENQGVKSGGDLLLLA